MFGIAFQSIGTVIIQFKVLLQFIIVTAPGAYFSELLTSTHPFLAVRMLAPMPDASQLEVVGEKCLQRPTAIPTL